MALPVNGQKVGNALYDIIFKGSYVAHNGDVRANVMKWINAVGLVLSSLPVSLSTDAAFKVYQRSCSGF